VLQIFNTLIVSRF
jgi:hypothetical protein